MKNGRDLLFFSHKSFFLLCLFSLSHYFFLCLFLSFLIFFFAFFSLSLFFVVIQMPYFILSIENPVTNELWGLILMLIHSDISLDSHSWYTGCIPYIWTKPYDFERIRFWAIRYWATLNAYDSVENNPLDVSLKCSVRISVLVNKKFVFRFWISSGG